MYVGGSWIESESGKRMEATSPATGETIGSVPEATRDDAGRAIAAANTAAREWAARSAFERAEAMERVAAIIEERRDDLARALVVDAELPAGVFNLVTGPGAVVGDEVAVNEGTHAIGFVGSSRYGLRTAVFTRDLRRGLRFAEGARAGWVNINESTNYWESHLPFGGRAGTQSGIGRVGGRFSMETFTELKTVVVNLG
jgi:acyl-CoA reductase-like NAD-dependent aldehyde dehydrogenase